MVSHVKIFKKLQKSVGGGRLNMLAFDELGEGGSGSKLFQIGDHILIHHWIQQAQGYAQVFLGPASTTINSIRTDELFDVSVAVPTSYPAYISSVTIARTNKSTHFMTCQQKKSQQHVSCVIRELIRDTLQSAAPTVALCCSLASTPLTSSSPSWKGANGFKHSLRNISNAAAK